MKTKYFSLPFDEGKAGLEKRGFKVPYAHENAELRIQRGYENSISVNGNWVREGPLYLRGDNTRLLRTGLPYLHPKEATNSHRNEEEYTDLNKDEVEKARAGGLEVLPNELNNNGNIVIPCNSMGSDKFGIWSFGGEGSDGEKSKRAQDHGDWLINSPYNIQQLIVYLDIQNYTEEVGDHANQFWLCSVGGDRSGLDGRCRGLDYCRVLGVCESAKGTQKKFPRRNKG